MLYPILLMLYMKGPRPPIVVDTFKTETECKREIEKMSGGWIIITTEGYEFPNGMVARCEPQI